MSKLKRSPLIMALFLMVGMIVLSPGSVRADETQELSNQVQALQQQVNALQNQMANQTAQPAAPTEVNRDDQWYPFEQMHHMDRQMNQMMQDNMTIFYPREDIKETPEAYIIDMDIPGMKKNKINIEVKNGMLIVSGNRQSEVKQSKPNQFYLQERSFGHFFRTMSLPPDAQTNGIEARYNNGVLTINISRNKLPKHEVGEQKIEVK